MGDLATTDRLDCCTAYRVQAVVVRPRLIGMGLADSTLRRSDMSDRAHRTSGAACPGASALARQPLAVMLGFLERLCPQRERVSVRHHVFVEKLHLDAVLTVEEQLGVDALAALDERPEPFARRGVQATPCRLLGVTRREPRLLVGHESRFY